jgi:hypothetical protein
MHQSQIYCSAIVEANRCCSAKYGKIFDALAAAQQKEMLRDLAGVDHAGAATGAVVVRHVVGNTPEGFFAHSMYGGNATGSAQRVREHRRFPVSAWRATEPRLLRDCKPGAQTLNSGAPDDLIIRNQQIMAK